MHPYMVISGLMGIEYVDASTSWHTVFSFNERQHESIARLTKGFVAQNFLSLPHKEDVKFMTVQLDNLR